MRIIDPKTGAPAEPDSADTEQHDPPAWHKDMDGILKMNIGGHWFSIGALFNDAMAMRYLEPSAKTLKRDNATKEN